MNNEIAVVMFIISYISMEKCGRIWGRQWQTGTEAE